jgi:hypothetical protein
VVGSCEHGNEPLGSVKCGKFDSLSDISFSRMTSMEFRAQNKVKIILITALIHNKFSQIISFLWFWN